MSRAPRLPEDDQALAAVLEALVFAADTPLPETEIAEVLEGIEPDRIRRTLDHLERSLEERGSGLTLERVAGGYRLTTRREVGEWVRRLYRFRNRRRLSPAALETLAIVAYRQPITAPEIQALRGVDPQGVLGSLLERHLIRIMGKKKVVGRPLLYGTTKHFLMHFGLDSLDDLPPLDSFGDVLGAEVDERLFEGGPAARPDEVEPLTPEDERAMGVGSSRPDPEGGTSEPTTPAEGDGSTP